MSAQSPPSLWRVLSDTSRIISSNSLHFASLSLIFIFPITLFNIIHTLIQPPSPSPFNSHYRRLLSTVDSTSQGQIPSFDISLLIYFLLILIFHLFSVSSVTHSIFHAFHKNPIKFSSSLKSILSSFLPLLLTKLAYFIIFVAISFGIGICIGAVLLCMTVTGLEIDPTAKSFMAVVFMMMILSVAVLVYLGVKWCLVDAIVVVESKYGFAPFYRSSSLVKGMWRVAFQIIAVLSILQWIMSGWFSVLAGGAAARCSGGVAIQMVVYAMLSTVVTLFGLAATAVLFIHCKALNGESEELKFDKLGEVYVQLTQDDVADKVSFERGLDIEATTKSFMSVVGFEAMIPVIMLLVYLGVEWCLMDAVVVVEYKCSFSVAKGMRRVLFLMITLLVILHGIMSGWFMLAIQKESNQRIYVEA
ncbi:hypothetical protein SASPL_107804 [Salvia splendens]|uniref:Uncharacterized protein n=1 Tax=Salvia splendens TaxID=180675 RepID=A0A8X8YH25_SALSN|nr:hypothetical protein SASPL_107804 [Salvia splendens]